MSQQVFSQKGKRQSGIKDVFHEDHVHVPQWRNYIFDELYLAACLFFGAVAADGYEIKSSIQLDLTGQVSKKKAGTFQHADEYDRLAGEILTDLLSDTANSISDFVAAQQDFHRSALRTDCLTNQGKLPPTGVMHARRYWRGFNVLPKDSGQCLWCG
jgi:hypothetical protein